LAPAGLVGNILGTIGGPLGGAIGSLFGQGQLGSQLGGLGGQLAQRYLPFSVDPVSAAYGQLAPQGILLPQTVADPETQALTAFLQGAAACLIPKLSSYLTKNAAQFPQLGNAIPLVTRAADFYGQRDYSRAFVQVYEAYRSISMLRAQQPSLPDPAG
jgi:hypothetical protein